MKALLIVLKAHIVAFLQLTVLFVVFVRRR